MFLAKTFKIRDCYKSDSFSGFSGFIMLLDGDDGKLYQANITPSSVHYKNWVKLVEPDCKQYVGETLTMLKIEYKKVLRDGIDTGERIATNKIDFQESFPRINEAITA